MSQLFTWAGLWQLASADAGITIQHGFNTAQNALAKMTKAQHELQTFTNAAHDTLTIAVSPTAGPVGSYTADIDLKQPLMAQFLPTGATQYIDVVPVTYDDMDALKRTAASNTMIGVTGLGANGTQSLWYTFDQGQIMLYPYAGVTGTFSLKYIPHLIGYDPANPAGRWLAFGAAPFTLMKTTGPAREFGTATSAIGDYMLAWLIESVDGGVQRFETRYKRALDNWETAKRFNVKDTVQMNKRRMFPGRNGVVR